MEKQYFIGDVDEFYCDAVDCEDRWAVWVVETVPLGNTVEDERARDRGAVARNQTTMLGRFYTLEDAQQFLEERKKSDGLSNDNNNL